jgi:hypothetical protein
MALDHLPYFLSSLLKMNPHSPSSAISVIILRHGLEEVGPTLVDEDNGADVATLEVTVASFKELALDEEVSRDIVMIAVVAVVVVPEAAALDGRIMTSLKEIAMRLSI